jgi:hypothetical protein
MNATFKVRSTLAAPLIGALTLLPPATSAATQSTLVTIGGSQSAPVLDELNRVVEKQGGRGIFLPDYNSPQGCNTVTCGIVCPILTTPDGLYYQQLDDIYFPAPTVVVGEKIELGWECGVRANCPDSPSDLSRFGMPRKNSPDTAAGGNHAVWHLEGGQVADYVPHSSIPLFGPVESVDKCVCHDETCLKPVDPPTYSHLDYAYTDIDGRPMVVLDNWALTSDPAVLYPFRVNVVAPINVSISVGARNPPDVHYMASGDGSPPALVMNIGNPYTGSGVNPSGIYFLANGQPPASYEGEFVFVQTLESGEVDSYTDGGTLVDHIPLGSHLVDGGYPYDVSTTTEDSPGSGPLPVGSNTITKVVASGTFVMALLWKPTRKPDPQNLGSSLPISPNEAVPVPIGSVAWHWTGAASTHAVPGMTKRNCDPIGKEWCAYGDPAVIDTITNPVQGTQNVTEYPTWDGARPAPGKPVNCILR